MGSEISAKTVRELNAAGEERLRTGDLTGAESSFRAALDVYDTWFKRHSEPLFEVLTSIIGLVRALELQGRHAEADALLETQGITVDSIVKSLSVQGLGQVYTDELEESV